MFIISRAFSMLKKCIIENWAGCNALCFSFVCFLRFFFKADHF